MTYYFNRNHSPAPKLICILYQAMSLYRIKTTIKKSHQKTGIQVLFTYLCSFLADNLMSEYQECSWNKGRPARKADNLIAIYELSRKCGNNNISQPYGPPRPVTGIPLLTNFTSQS
jgi:hypothetical protein